MFILIFHVDIDVNLFDKLFNIINSWPSLLNLHIIIPCNLDGSFLWLKTLYLQVHINFETESFSKWFSIFIHFWQTIWTFFFSIILHAYLVPVLNNFHKPFHNFMKLRLTIDVNSEFFVLFWLKIWSYIFVSPATNVAEDET